MNHLCVFDMDETLLSPDKTVSSENLAALKKLKGLGIGITVATGRSPFMTGKYIDLLSLDLPLIACNGGMVITADMKNIIWENPIDPSLLDVLFAYLLDQKADFVAYTPEMVYYSEDSIRVLAFREYNRTVPVRLQAPLQVFTQANLSAVPKDIVKILLYYPTPLQETFLKGIPGLEIVSSGENFLDIMQDGSTKGNAVLELGRYLNIPVENIAVFGDNENDISMFTCGALAIAMGNSPKEIRKFAKFVTGTNKQSGVAQAIYRHVLPYFGYPG